MSTETLGTISTFTGRIENMFPSAYRLARRLSGEYVLQGRFDWIEEGGHARGGEWRDLPTEYLS